MNNIFYFSLSFQFKTDYDVSKLEKIIGLKAKKVTFLSDSKGPVPTAKCLFCSKEFDQVYSDKLFEQFVDFVYKKATNIIEILETNDGTLNFCVVFKKIASKPCLFISNTTLKQLSEMGTSFDVDFI